MNTLYRFLIFSTIFSWIFSLQAEVVIFPVGDSITHGAGGTTYGWGPQFTWENRTNDTTHAMGWRAYCENLMRANNVDYDYVGRFSYGGNVLNTSGDQMMWDQDHSGIGGISGLGFCKVDPFGGGAAITDVNDPTTVEIELSLQTVNKPIDYAMVMLGTNDRSRNPIAGDIYIDYTEAVWDYIWHHSPNAHIIVSYIPPAGGDFWTTWNAKLQAKVDGLIAGGKAISIIDPGWDNADMLGGDGLHPTSVGHEKLGTAFYNELARLLGSSNPTGYDSWATSTNWGSVASGDRDATDDPDMDGLTNFIEYALGSEPISDSTANFPTVEKSGNDLVFKFQRSQSGVTYTVQASTDMQNWSDVSTNPGSVGGEVQVNVSQGSAPVFIRLYLSE